MSSSTAFCTPVRLACPEPCIASPRRGVAVCRLGPTDSPRLSRRAVLVALTALMLPHTARASDGKASTTADSTSEDSAESPITNLEDNDGSKRSITGHQTTTGITYVDYRLGDGPTPEWGDLVNIDYVLYTINKSRNGIVQHDSSFKRGKDGLLLHHGNGENIKGLEEMIHSMRVGARRRCIIPPKMAYTKTSLLPSPPGHIARRKFVDALGDTDGTVVLDVELNWFKKDPFDRGYYNDLVPSEDELRKIIMDNKGIDFDT